jgi:2-polyprenyl-3-methyl-5-hydroxy-6-metoxy-1,4-benzoquinol methylase
VRSGYDALSYRYRADQAGEGGYAGWLDLLRDRVPPGGSVLDLGCGAGVPVARALAAGGFAVTGAGGHALFWARRPLAGGGGGTGR